MSNGPYAWLRQMSKFHHQFSFGHSFELFCLGNPFIQNFAAIKCTQLVVIDKRESSYVFFIIIIIIWIDTRLIKHINLLGLVLLRVNINKIEIFNLRINFSSLVTKQIGNFASQLT